MNTRETTLRTALRKALNRAGVWSFILEYGQGGSAGAPDLMVGIPILPVELKVGFWDGGRIYPREVRPAQIAWMDKFVKAGGSCRLVIGEYDNHWAAWSLAQCGIEALRGWRHGFPSYAVKKIMLRDQLLVGPEDW